MPYDSTHPKISQNNLLAKVANAPRPKVEDISLMNFILAPRHIGLFYGTDSADARNTYGATLLEALNNRVVDPMRMCWQQRRACFFKPYQSVWQGVVGAYDGLTIPAITVVYALGLLGTFGGSPYMMIAAACTAAAVEFITGFIALGQSLYHKVKSKTKSNQTVAEQARAGEYFQDAVTRFALVLPLVMIGTLAVPVDFIRFFTRCIATLVKLVSKNHMPEHVEPSVRTPLLQQ